MQGPAAPHNALHSPTKEIFFILSYQCRFYAIVRPLAASKATRNMKYFLAAAWIVAAVSASPQVSEK